MTAVDAVCDRCGFTNAAGIRFWDGCGTKLAGPGIGEAGKERRPATVLFADIAGSTSMGESMDLETVEELITGTSRC